LSGNTCKKEPYALCRTSSVIKTNNMKIFKSGRDLSIVAKTIDTINLMLNDINPKIESSRKYSEFNGDMYMLAYALRKNVIDLMKENNWSVHIKIMVSSFNKRRISLLDTFTEIYNSLNKLAIHMGCHKEVKSILDKGSGYYEFESVLPKEVIECLS
jgi:hypothetical protein